MSAEWFEELAERARRGLALSHPLDNPEWVSARWARAKRPGGQRPGGYAPPDNDEGNDDGPDDDAA
jgi:hypothetical protein